MTNRPALLLVPGAWHGSWCWQPTADRLVEAGFAVHPVDLPSVAATGPRAGLHDDAAAVRARLAEIDGPVVVIAHSYGGAVATEAAAALPNVRGVVYVAAWQLDRGESLLGYRGGQPPAWWQVEGDTVTPRDPANAFYHDVDPALAADAIARLRPISLTAFTEPLDAAAWPDIPSTYVICEQDRAVPVALQEELSARSNAVHRLPTSHSPFLARPADTARLLAEIATRTYG